MPIWLWELLDDPDASVATKVPQYCKLLQELIRAYKGQNDQVMDPCKPL